MPNTRKLILRPLAIDTYHEHIAYIHRQCPLYQSEEFRSLFKVQISNNGDSILATLNIIEGDELLNPNEIGLSIPAFKAFSQNAGCEVQLSPPQPVHSMQAVRAKINGQTLDKTDFMQICQDIIHKRYTNAEIAAFLVACTESGLDRNEVFYLTEAMIETGKRFQWDHAIVVDKHCIGGIPGNRTTMIVTPIIAAHGMLMPKTSSRAITSPAGTADTMETLAEVQLSFEKLQKIVQQTNACLAWGGTAQLAPVDDLLISVERPLKLDSVGQMVASILSKKVAAGSTHLLIDIPVGDTAKVRSMQDAIKLRKLFEFVGDQLKLNLEVMITDGKQPIGRGIGPTLEARDVLQVLNNDPNAPHDLKEKSLELAGRILEFDPDIRGGQGYHLARDILESGRAMTKMQQIIELQGAKTLDLQPAKYSLDITAPQSGRIEAIDNLHIAHLAHIAGAPFDKKAGIDLIHKVGQQVNQGDLLYRIYCERQANQQFVKDLIHRQGIGYQLSEHTL